MMKGIFNTLLCSILFVCSVQAHEGMWLPILLDMDDMQRNGLKLSEADIYSINQASLKDAIVHFGGGCTAEAISDQGLILTNHHCGYSAIQNLSSVENDYLKDGFWANDQSGELHCPGLTATFIVSIEDVTDQVLEGIDEQTDWAERQTRVAAKSLELSEVTEEGAGYSAEVKSFYYGNQYIRIVKRTYSDVRLVGAPPSSIGKFGGDTDNWVWPRHTGDFSMFRIYADGDNEPADFKEDNVPYVPAKSLEISLNGVKEGDFTMVYGFPGVTDQYIHSSGMEYVKNVVNPLRIEMRAKSLEVIDAAMASSDELRIQYAARQSMISNAYKKWIGQNMGLDRFDAIEKKKAQEEAFLEKARDAGNKRYEQVLDTLELLHAKIQPYQLARDLFIEFFFYGPEILNFTRKVDALIGAIESEQDEEKIAELREKAVRSVANHFKNYDLETDRKVFENLLGAYTDAVNQDLQPSALDVYQGKYGKNAEKYTDYIYSKSIFTDPAKLTALLQSGKTKKIVKLKEDPAHELAASFLADYAKIIKPDYDLLNSLIDAEMQIYMKGLMELHPEKKYWSEANSTLRVTYGKVEGCIPRDGLSYLPTTTLEGVVHKYVPGDKEFDVPEKLIELYEQKDFGQYGTDQTMNVAFLASNHTTGGNSGSPVLNAEGQLIGLNFDRSWESTMSDLMFNPEICRNISVDIRYILFIVDKYAGAGWLLDEMKIIKN